MMEFLEAMKKANKICNAYEDCKDCPLLNTSNKLCVLRVTYDCDFEKIEKIISEWEPPVDWSKVKVDTLILVWNDIEHKHKRYFAKYENGKIYAYFNGNTSWSVEGDECVTSWKHAELAEVENDER